LTQIKPDTDVAGPSLSRSVLMVAEHTQRDHRVSDRPARAHLGRDPHGLHHLLVRGTLDPCEPGV